MIARGTTLVVSASTYIGRRIDVVRRHFGDVEHHARYPVHPDIQFTPLSDSGDERRFRKTMRVLGVPLVDEVVLRRHDDGSITEESVAGFTRGMRLTSRFRGDGPLLTAATLTVEMPLRGWKRLAAPVLRRLLAQRLVKGLEEDRRDLESGRYPPPSRPAAAP